MLRVCSVPESDPSQSYSFKLDPHKKQITLLNVPTLTPQRQTAGTTVSSKTFTFDAAFGHDSTQVRAIALLFLSHDMKTDLSNVWSPSESYYPNICNTFRFGHLSADIQYLDILLQHNQLS